MSAGWITALVAVAGALRALAAAFSQWLDERRRLDEGKRDDRAKAYGRLATALAARRKADRQAAAGRHSDGRDAGVLPDDPYRRD